MQFVSHLAKRFPIEGIGRAGINEPNNLAASRAPVGSLDLRLGGLGHPASVVVLDAWRAGEVSSPWPELS
jgi:hypothetical protein